MEEEGGSSCLASEGKRGPIGRSRKKEDLVQHKETSFQIIRTSQ